jgi:hypothetical protein
MTSAFSILLKSFPVSDEPGFPRSAWERFILLNSCPSCSASRQLRNYERWISPLPCELSTCDHSSRFHAQFCTKRKNADIYSPPSCRSQKDDSICFASAISQSPSPSSKRSCRESISSPRDSIEGPWQRLSEPALHATQSNVARMSKFRLASASEGTHLRKISMQFHISRFGDFRCVWSP